MDKPQQMTDVSGDHTLASADDRDLLPKEKLKRFFLGIPIVSLLVGGALLIAEVVVIILVLVSPETVGISEEAALSRVQRGVLGGVSIVMLIEAVLFGTIDIGTNRQRARLIKTQRQLLMKQLDKLRSEENVDGLKSVFSLQQVGQLLEDQIISTERIRRRLKPSLLPEVIDETAQELKELNTELNNHTIKYMAALVFDLASFMWKWALALLVISNNWLSVGLVIAGGVVYPLVVFWQKAIHPKA
jgi:hypothetical protein